MPRGIGRDVGRVHRSEYVDTPSGPLEMQDKYRALRDRLWEKRERLGPAAFSETEARFQLAFVQSVLDDLAHVCAMDAYRIPCVHQERLSLRRIRILKGQLKLFVLEAA